MNPFVINGKKGRYSPNSIDPYEVSRSKVELFLSCARCFWLDRRQGIAPPSSPPYTLNSAIDGLLKREFDRYRVAKETHPLLKAQGLSLVPAQRPELEEWRINLKGVRVLETTTHLLVYGSIDDLWEDEQGTYYVADYKATAKNGSVGIDADWQVSYKRQVELYQWLLRQRGLPVSDQAWFVYANGQKNRDLFDGTLHFDISLIPYEGNTDWVVPTLQNMHRILNKDSLPAAAASCKLCSFVARTAELLS